MLQDLPIEPRDAMQFDPTEFQFTAYSVIEAIRNPSVVGRPQVLRDTQLNRLGIAAMNRFPNDDAKSASFLIRFLAIIDLFKERALPSDCLRVSQVDGNIEWI